MLPGDLPQAARVHPVPPVRLEVREDPCAEPGECCHLTGWNVHRKEGCQVQEGLSRRIVHRPFLLGLAVLGGLAEGKAGGFQLPHQGPVILLLQEDTGRWHRVDDAGERNGVSLEAGEEDPVG